MADNILRIGAEFDVSQIVAGARVASESFDQVTNSAIEMATSLQASGLSTDEIRQQMIDGGVAAQTTDVAIAQLAATEEVVAATATEAAGAHMKMSGAMGMARVEAGALSGSTGMVLGGMARLAAQSSMLAPLITAAFPIFGALALVEILKSVYASFAKASEEIMGYTKAVQEAEKADIKFSDEAMSHALTLAEAHEKLTDVLRREGDIAAESFGDKYAKSSEKAENSTSQLLGIIPGLRNLIVTYESLAHAESDAADQAVKLETAQRSLITETMQLQLEMDREAIKLIGDRVAAQDSALTGDIARVASIRNEIAALNDKQKVEEDIAVKEAGLKALQQHVNPVQAAQQAKSEVDEEYYYKRIELTNKLSAAEQEYEEKRMEGFLRTQEAFSSLRAQAERNAAAMEKLKSEEDKLFDLPGESSREQGEAIKQAQVLADQQVKYQEEVSKLAEQSAQRRIADEEEVVKSTGQIELQARQAHALTEYGRVLIADQVNAEILAKLRKLEDEKLAIELQGIEAQKAILLGGQTEQSFVVNSDPAQLAKLETLNRQIEAAKQAHTAKMGEFDRQEQQSAQKTADAEMQAFMKVFQPVGRAFDGMVNGILQGTLRVSEAFRRMGANIVISTIDAIAQMGLRWAEHFIVVEVLEHVSILRRIGDFIAGEGVKKSVQVAAAVSEVTEQAGIGAAGAYASALVALPFPVNIAVAPEVAATQFGAIMGIGLPKAETGAYIPRDMAIFAHQGEQVLSRGSTEEVGKMAKTFNDGGSGSQNIGIHINALDSKSINDFLHGNKAAFTKLIRQQVRNGVRARA